MADVKGMLNDPEFNKLPLPQQKAALGRLDPEFSGLTDQQFQDFRSKLAGPSILPIDPTGKPPRPNPPAGPRNPLPPPPTAAEWKGMAVEALPYVGAGVATALAPEGAPLWGTALLAGAGGAAGKAVESTIKSNVGQEKLSGPTFQVEPPPGSRKDAIWGIAKSGGEQALFEFGGGLAAKLLRGVLGGPLHAGTRSYENQIIKEANEKYGLNLTAQEVTDSARMSQRLGEYSILSQSFIRRKWGEGTAAGMKAIDEVLGRLYPTSSPSEAARSVRGMLKLSRDIFQHQAQNIYERQLKPVAAQIPINMRPVKRVAADMLADLTRNKTAYGELGGMGPKTERLLQDIVASPDDVAFEIVHNMRTNLMQVTPAPEELMAGKVQAVSKRLLKETTDAMDVSLSAANPQVRQIWEEAREFYKTGAEIFDHEAIQGMMSRDPVGLVKSIKPGDADMAERVREAILKYPQQYGNPGEKTQAELTWRQFQEQFARTNLLQDPEHVGGKLEPEELFKISDRIKSMGPGVLNEIYGGTPGGREALLNIKQIGDAFGRVQRLPSEGRKYVYDILNVALGAMPGIYGHNPTMALAGAVGFEGLPLVMSAVVHSKVGTGYLLDGIGGAIKAFGNRPMKMVGKGAVKLQDWTVTSDASYKYLGRAMADLARAGAVYKADRDKMEKNREKYKVPPSAGAGKQQDALHLMLNEWQ